MANLEYQAVQATELMDSLPEIVFPQYRPRKTFVRDGDGNDIPTSLSDAAEAGVIESVRKDDKPSLIAHAKQLEQNSEPLDRNITSKLLQLCCTFDSVLCAAALIAGEVGEVALVNEADETGRMPLHAAAEYQSARCVELLLRKRARTDVKTKDGRGLLPLELSITSARFDMDGIWNPEDYSIEDLIVLLGEKDLTTIRLISEKSKEVAKIACAKAAEGSIMALGALLVVAAEKINDSTVELDDGDQASKPTTTTVFEWVVRKALSLGRETTTQSSSLGASDDIMKKRELLLAEIELLQLFEVVSRCPDKNATSLLVRAIQAGDEDIVALLLKTDMDINEPDNNGNCALHYFLKASKSFSQHEIKIIALLIAHGARVGQKNKLGVTAIHMAAANGHFSALQILLIEDSEGINYKTEMKETPLFFAVKHDHLDCAEFLLLWGASSEVLNIRRQRPIDLAISQDMRFMLNPTNVCLIKRVFPGQQKYINKLLNMDGNCGSLPTDEGTSSQRTSTSTTTDICTYLSARQGCVRGADCFCLHDEEEKQSFHHGTHHHSWPKLEAKLRKRIFVGGLPLSLDSASLRKYFEETFGPVEDAKVLLAQKEDHIQSRGFGFVTFRDEKDAEVAINAHYVLIMDKQVEIKSVIPKGVYPRQLWTQPESEVESDKHETQSKISSEAQGQAQVSFEDQQTPAWLRIFKKWLPSFLNNMSKHQREGHYALSSLKADFMSKFGLELDHSSLGYAKLSDFMRCFSDICCIGVLPSRRGSGGGSPNHMVLLPKSLRTQQLLQRLSTTQSFIGGGEKCLREPEFSLEGDLNPGSQDCNPAEIESSPNEFDILSLSDALPMFMQLLEQDPLFHIRPWLQSKHVTDKDNTNREIEALKEEANQKNPNLRRRHLVLEALAKTRKYPSVYFLREFDFYSNYNEGVKEGKCFACNEQKTLWANIPCQHLLWCVDCKTRASLAAGSSVHKCVVCDAHVQRIDLLTCHDYRQLVSEYLFNEEFPPLRA